jgi:potassium-transporting ATPase KdpC subunit
MKPQIIISIKILLVFTVLTGIIYPLFITGISQLTFPVKANGSWIIKGNRIIGSNLIGQSFSSDKYFWPRPSAISYKPLPSSGSNYGMTSQILKDKSYQEEQLFIQKNHLSNGIKIPKEMIYSSASGLDPDISVEAAKLQVKRVAMARNIKESQIFSLIESLKNERQFFILGEQRINVLMLNIELDKLINK